ncbi:hypothetical protein N0V88_006613 [Collariella sp. IMI 366227]|nr:hypothetical protein N0V88_006613 [Collariella sp. IMI 366227]
MSTASISTTPNPETPSPHPAPKPATATTASPVDYSATSGNTVGGGLRNSRWAPKPTTGTNALDSTDMGIPTPAHSRQFLCNAIISSTRDTNPKGETSTRDTTGGGKNPKRGFAQFRWAPQPTTGTTAHGNNARGNDTPIPAPSHQPDTPMTPLEKNNVLNVLNSKTTKYTPINALPPATPGLARPRRGKKSTALFNEHRHQCEASG